jgi:hypothetical protein
MREWQEIQKMLRYLVLISFSLCAYGALLPETIGSLRRGEVTSVALENRALWNEYGFQEAERASFSGDGQRINITAWRFGDPTGAFAAQQWLRSAEDAMQYENYVLRISGSVLSQSLLEELGRKLAQVVRSSLPPLSTFVPTAGKIEKSERYLLGPESLAAFENRIPASTAAFSRGAEAITARYMIGKEEGSLTLFSYPTPQMAMALVGEFLKIPEARIRRTGPLVAVLFAADTPESQKFLEGIQYGAKLTWSEETPRDEGNPGDMLAAIVTLAGILIVASVFLGLIFGGLRITKGRFGMRADNEDFTSLNIGGN